MAKSRVRSSWKHIVAAQARHMGCSALRLVPCVALYLVLCLVVVWGSGAGAGERFKIDGARLIYDSFQQDSGRPAEMVTADIDSFRRLLKKHSDIKELELNSSGGSVYAGHEIAWLVLDYGLNTLVSGECVSACVEVFLAGNRRQMALGSKIGFHRRSWAPGDVGGYYKDQRDTFGWESPYDYGSWIYEDTQNEVYELLKYMVARGVTPGFAIETLQAGSETVWYPTRLQLIAAKVLREAAD